MFQMRLFRPIIAVIGSVLLVSGLMFLPSKARPPAAAQTPQPQDQPLRRSVTVSGSGSVSVQPDIAYITLGVQTDAETASEALEQNNEQMESVISALEAAGIASEDIQTSMIQLFPRYDEPGGAEPAPDTAVQSQSPQVTGYTAVNTVQVTVRDIDDLGSVLDQVVEAGGNRIEYIRFDVSNQTQALEQARTAAFANAQQKAEQLAGLAEAELGQIITINESSYFPITFQEEEVDAAQAASAVPISPGTQSIAIDLTVTWEMQ